MSSTGRITEEIGVILDPAKGRVIFVDNDTAKAFVINADQSYTTSYTVDSSFSNVKVESVASADPVTITNTGAPDVTNKNIKISCTQNDGHIQIVAPSSASPSAYGSVTIQGGSVNVSSDSALQLTGGVDSDVSMTSQGASGYVEMRDGGSPSNARITTNSQDVGMPNNVTDSILLYTLNGHICLDGQLQYRGGTPPSTSVGFNTDIQGDISMDSNYLYYCSAPYDGVTNIWKRIAWSGDTW